MTLIEGLKAGWDGIVKDMNEKPITYLGFTAGGLVLLAGLISLIIVRSHGLSEYWVARGTMLIGAGIIGISGLSLGCHKLHEWSSEKKDTHKAAAVWHRFEEFLDSKL